MVASDLFDLLVRKYTAGEAIDPMRAELDRVVAAYERATRQLRLYHENPNAAGFQIDSFDGYCPCLGMISLCFLLHRRDLLPRLAELLDGPDSANAGADFLIEEFLAYAPMDRYQSNTLLVARSFESLADAMDSSDNEDALEHLRKFLGRWYQDLAGAPWHDAHKPDADGRTGGYCGHWSFEAAAAVLLLGIETTAASTPIAITRRISPPGRKQSPIRGLAGRDGSRRPGLRRYSGQCCVRLSGAPASVRPRGLTIWRPSPHPRIARTRRALPASGPGE